MPLRSRAAPLDGVAEGAAPVDGAGAAGADRVVADRAEQDLAAERAELVGTGPVR